MTDAVYSQFTHRSMLGSCNLEPTSPAELQTTKKSSLL